MFLEAAASSDGFVHITMSGSIIALIAERVWSSISAKKKNGNGNGSYIDSKTLELMQLKTAQAVTDAIMPALENQTKAIQNQTEMISKMNQSLELERKVEEIRREFESRAQAAGG